MLIHREIWLKNTKSIPKNVTKMQNDLREDKNVEKCCKALHFLFKKMTENINY